MVPFVLPGCLAGWTSFEDASFGVVEVVVVVVELADRE